jgi:hypothetical protein
MVFVGLTLTATDSLHYLGPDVAHGTILVLIGSALHAGSYVWSEAVMMGHDGLTIRQNSALQGLVACVLLVLWQLVYTVPRWQTLIVTPMNNAHTTKWMATIIMIAFAVANLVHSYSFYHTIRFYKGGSVSAGVMKGLQAVLVFVAAHVLYCGRTGGHEMCFTTGKFLSLVTVTGGVVFFSWTTAKNYLHNTATARTGVGSGGGYTKIDNVSSTNTNHPPSVAV